MIHEKDLQQAITECQAERNPNYHTCMKLAAYYYLYDRMQGPAEIPAGPAPAYSFAAGPDEEPSETLVLYDSGTDFADALAGKRVEDVWPVIDELMDVLGAIQPRLHNAVLQKIKNL